MEQIELNVDLSDNEERRNIWKHTVTPVTFVTTAWEGKQNVMACEWAFMCRRNPSMQFLIVLGKHKLTSEYILKSKEFGLTFASDEQTGLSHLAGSHSGYDLDKIGTNKFTLKPSKVIKAPLIEGGLVDLECKVNQIIDNEERYIIIGDVVNANYRDDKTPLIYHKGKYFKLGENLPKVNLLEF